MLEKTIEGRVTRWAKRNGWIVEKVKFANGGYPDRIYFGYGCTVLIEYKRPGEEPTKLQLERISELRKHGIRAAWFDNSVGATAYLKAVMVSARISEARHFNGAADVLRAAARSGPGKNCDHARSDQDPSPDGVHKTRSRRSP